MTDSTAERRRPDPDIQLIKQDIAYIKTFIAEDRAESKDHIKTSEVYRDKVSKLYNVKDKLDEHILQDRWLHTTIIGLLLFVLGKLYLGQ